MTLLNEKDTALLLGCSVYKLQKDRCKGSPIPYKKLGKAVRYALVDLQKYLDDQSFTSTSQYKGGR